MPGHGRTLTHTLLLVAGAVVVIAGHAMILYQISSRTTLSIAIVSSIIGLVVIKHLGLFGPLFVLARRGFRRPGADSSD